MISEWQFLWGEVKLTEGQGGYCFCWGQGRPLRRYHLLSRVKETRGNKACKSWGKASCCQHRGPGKGVFSPSISEHSGRLVVSTTDSDLGGPGWGLRFCLPNAPRQCQHCRGLDPTGQQSAGGIARRRATFSNTLQFCKNVLSSLNNMILTFFPSEFTNLLNALRLSNLTSECIIPKSHLATGGPWASYLNFPQP